MKTPYQTTALRNYPAASQYTNKLEVLLIESPHELPDVESFIKPIGSKTNGIRVLLSEDRDIPPILHPLTIRHRDQIITWVDLRPSVRLKLKVGGYIAVDPTEAEFTIRRGLLTHAVERFGYDQFIALMDLPIVALARFVSENITRRLALNPEEQMRITAATAFYVLFCCKAEGDVTEKTKQGWVQRIARLTRIDAATLFEIADSIQYTNDIAGLVTAIKAVVFNRRVDDLEAGFIIAALGGGWFGPNGREVFSVALEHAPTLVAMTYTALTNRSYQKAGYSVMVDTCNKNGLGEQFIKGVDYFLRAHEDE